jgi:hypothetical protein
VAKAEDNHGAPAEHLDPAMPPRHDDPKGPDKKQATAQDPDKDADDPVPVVKAVEDKGAEEEPADARPKARGKKKPKKPAEKAEPEEKEKEPDADAQERAEHSLREVYKADYDRKKPAALAAKFLRVADETKNDSAIRFVLLREARELAAKAGEPATAMRAINLMGDWYEIKPAEIKLAVLEKLAKSASAPATAKGLVEAALAATEEAVVADNFDSAFHLLDVAAKAVDKAQSKALSDRVAARRPELEEQKADYGRFRQAAKTLKDKPNDPDANLSMGRYLCLTKGNWGDGLPMLAKGSDPRLKAIGDKGADEPTEAAEQLDLADLLWDWAEQQSGSSKAKVQARAKDLYWQALPELEGVQKTKVANRLRLVVGKSTLMPGLVAELFNDTKFERLIKTRVDYRVDFDWGNNAPDPVLKNGWFGIRWRGYLKPPKAGTYTLIIKSDNGSRIWLDRRLLGGDLSTSETPTHTFRLHLTERPHLFFIEFVEGSPPSYIHVTWIPPAASEAEPVPAYALYHDRPQARLLPK